MTNGTNGRRLSLVVAPELASVAEARHFVVAALADLGGTSDPLDTVALLTSEVVANAVQVSATEISVHVSATDGGRLRVEVDDSGPGLPVVRNADPLADDGGRGLMIVEALALDWGVEPVPGGKRVWFEAPLRADGSSSQQASSQRTASEQPAAPGQDGVGSEA